MTFPVPLLAAEPELQAAAAKLAAYYGLPSVQSENDFVLELTSEGLQLRWLAKPDYQPLQLDFTRGKQAWRQKLGGGKQEAVIRAIGLAHGHRPRVLDATAGLGRDGMIIAHSGCPVWLLERNPAVHALLDQAVLHAKQHEKMGSWVAERVHILPAGSLLDLTAELKTQLEVAAPEAIYLDPMFPERDKKAQVKKDMQMLQHLIGGDQDSDQLLPAALSLASHRVIVKRPARAPYLAGQTPNSQIQSKKHRFDIYIKKPYR